MDREFTRCPLRPFYEASNEYNQLLSQYRQYQNGYLPEAGAIGDQPAKTMRLFDIIETTLAKINKEDKPAASRPKGNPFAGQVKSGN